MRWQRELGVLQCRWMWIEGWESEWWEGVGGGAGGVRQIMQLLVIHPARRASERGLAASRLRIGGVGVGVARAARLLRCDWPSRRAIVRRVHCTAEGRFGVKTKGERERE